ncbi:SPOR domain-containing protein [Massilibacteroides sp.]|uniref:HU domain-containing protein n=1 Tax=Massilibacteroides sp. TaxID=2034766 RepID=UPI0026218CEC|nr:SPOR domain-containing protein [Massilibacteroides sp.]MDD4516421.1 SPOR domain-containing protein [Massilibacteroides sp.]
MLRLVTHIEQLLFVHDCVIVPKLGGFVLQSVPASYSGEEHIFHPMRKELLFNATLKHQDGLLAESYMKMYDVNYRKATDMIEEDVTVLLHRLNESGQIDFNSMGTLQIGSEGQYVFLPAEDNPLSVVSYGLPSFYFTPLALLKRESEDLFTPIYKQEEKKKDAVYIRINRSFLRVAGAAAAVVVLILLISTPVKDVNPSTYTASFIPTTEIRTQKQAIPESAVEVPTLDEAPTVSIDVKDVEPAEAVAVVEPQKLNNGKTYYIVIGSFPNEELCNKYITEVDKEKYPRVGYVRRGEKVRVYSDKFENRAEAETYLATLRQTDKHKDAWLFISR